MINEILEKNNSELVIYESKDGNIKLDVSSSIVTTIRGFLFI